MWCLFGDWLAGRSQAGIGKAEGEGLNKVRKMLWMLKERRHMLGTGRTFGNAVTWDNGENRKCP